MAVRIEDAGFEIRDLIMWCYGSGFPKSLDVSKAIDKAAGAERKVIGRAESWNRPDSEAGHTARMNVSPGEYDITAPATPEAQQWAGWGTALKPALEPITLARKPLEGTVAANVLAHGTGGLNIDGCRVEHVTVEGGNLALNPHLRAHINGGNGGNIIAHEDERRVVTPHASGRWPANLIHDGSDEVVGLFPVSGNGSGKSTIAKRERNKGWCNSSPGEGVDAIDNYGDSGSAARFFYTAKASRDDRSDGNTHPTVKPTDLMRYLCRLVTPPGGTVLDPFMGSGSTGKAAMLEGFEFIGIEREPQYFAIAEQRITRAAAAGYQPSLLESA
jgi:hypothetical protein